MDSNRRFWVSQALGLGVFVTCQGVAWIWPALKMALFCRPAAVLSSWFLGVPVEETARGLQLMHERYDIFVVASCSGFDFFALLLAVFFAMAFRFSERRRWRWVVWGGAAYAITIAANTARIVCSVYARVSSDALPFNFPAEVTHFAVGTAIFATVLIASCHFARWVLLKRRLGPDSPRDPRSLDLRRPVERRGRQSGSCRTAPTGSHFHV